MATWKGKSRGGLLGYKIFVFIISYTGLGVAYFVLRFVAFYFLFAAYSASKTSYRFFRERLGYSKWKAIFSVYKNHYTFGQVLLDKVAILSGKGKIFTFDFDGIHNLQQIVEEGNGGLLISAHIGNWEVASQLLEHLNAKVNVVMMDAEYDQIKGYLSSVTEERVYNVIAIKDDMSHIFEISKALVNKELICIHGDRFVESSKVVECLFLGENAYFPAGPFSIASRMKVPATYVYAMKETNTHYHFFATKPFTYNGSLPDFVLSYAQALEEKVKKYPTQWFNYYDFWSKDIPVTKVNK